MATIPIFSAPQRLSMLDFWQYTDVDGGLAKSCRFAVVIRPQGEFIINNGAFAQELMYMCEVAELPGRGFMNIDLRYYGPSFKLPFQTQYEDINLTFLCRNGSFERQFFDDWQLVINPVNTFDFNYRDQYRAEIDIYQFSEYAADESGSPEATYFMTLHDAYPIMINPQPMTWQDDQFQRLVVAFTYTKWSRKGIDPEPRQGPGGFSFDLVAGRQVER